MARAEPITGFKLQVIGLDGAGEHRENMFTELQRIASITFEFSPPYAPQSNGHAE